MQKKDPWHHKNGNHKDNRISNLVYKHAYCHRQYHAINPKPNNLSDIKDYEMLELYEVKVSRIVLKGESGSNPTRLT